MKLTSMFVALGMLQAAMAQTIAPSPTESVGCEPHGDHWHCEGPRSTDAPAPSTDAAEEAEPTTDSVTSVASVTSDVVDDVDSTVDPGPSPTESEGCEPHGDHWHCHGAEETGSDEEASGADPEPTESAPVDTNAAGALQMNLGAAVAVAALALL